MSSSLIAACGSQGELQEGASSISIPFQEANKLDDILDSSQNFGVSIEETATGYTIVGNPENIAALIEFIYQEDSIEEESETDCYGKKWWHFHIRHLPPTPSDCYSTKKRTKAGAAIWYAHLMPIVVLTGVGASWLEEGRCHDE